MIKVFESIYQILDQDHKTNLLEFNQKPYYRILLSLYTIINLSQCFNPQTQ